MKINELVEKYNKNARIDLVKELEVQPYVSIALKREMAQLVLDNCTTVVDGVVHINSVDRYLLFTMAVIGVHTNLEFVDEEDQNHYAIDDYDALSSSGLLIKIIDTFKDDYASCQEILNMMTADRLQESVTVEQKIIKCLDVISQFIGNGIQELTDKINVDDLVNSLPSDQTSLVDLYNLFKGK